jgi:RNA recognition motif-containing protein
MVDVKRVFVGGLTPEITVDELKERFQRFCEVLDVQIKKKRNCESMTAKILTIVFFYMYSIQNIGSPFSNHMLLDKFMHKNELSI